MAEEKINGKEDESINILLKKSEKERAYLKIKQRDSSVICEIMSSNIHIRVHTHTHIHTIFYMHILFQLKRENSEKEMVKEKITKNFPYWLENFKLHC